MLLKFAAGELRPVLEGLDRFGGDTMMFRKTDVAMELGDDGRRFRLREGFMQTAPAQGHCGGSDHSGYDKLLDRHDISLDDQRYKEVNPA